jgi:hypothetical protein
VDSSSPESTNARSYVGVIGHGPLLEREDGAVSVLKQLGATVRAIDLWDEPSELIYPSDAIRGMRPRALVFEALDRPDLGIAALRSVRKEATFDNVGALIAVTVGQLARIDPASGFDDFVLHPYVPEELYARIRSIEWKRSEFSTEERYKVGPIVIDRADGEGIRAARVLVRAPGTSAVARAPLVARLG